MKTKLYVETVRAKAEEELVRITDLVRERVRGSGVREGIVFVISAHTTAGILVNEGLECVEKDLVEQLDRLAPEDYPYHHNHFLPSYCSTGSNMPGHFKSTLTGNHCVYPVQEGEMVSGDMQDIYLAEFDGIKPRRIFIYVLGD